MTAETEVVFPRTLSDIYPMAAQQLYIETYKLSWATPGGATQDRMSRESVASRDAWNAVWREYIQDDVTHKWRRKGDQAAAESTPTGKRSLFGAIKGMLKR